MRAAHRLSVAAALFTVLALVAGCGQTVSGRAKASLDTIDLDTAAGLPLTDSPDGPKTGAPAAKLKVQGGIRTEDDKIAVNTLSDVFAYWTEAMPKYFGGQQFSPPRSLIAYDSRKDEGKVCGQKTKNYVNAFYCPPDKSVAWDRGVLLPTFHQQLGPNGISVVLAHEMGHAVQDQLGAKSKMDERTPTIVREQQADCYAGNVFRWAAENKAPHFVVSTGAGINKAMAAMIYVRDEIGAHSDFAPGSHGTAFDRVSAFQTGFAKDPLACAAIDKAEYDKRSTEKLPSKQEKQQSGQAFDAATTLPLLKQSLDGAFASTKAPSPEFVTGQGKCSGNTPPVSYCDSDNTVNIDKSGLEQIGNGSFPSGSLRDLGNKNVGGDFSALAEVASRYTLSMQKHVGLEITGEQAGLRSACLTGSWAKYSTERHGSGQQLRLAVGDLDEAIAELLQPNSVIADDVHGNGVRSGFARVEAFRTGYDKGSTQCASQFG